eukprot:TRINITY_DN6820_c0_g2_i2.p4 TRINITY_DN6820_c0_g2~~TRINITY_DN6820_c0_g2_i2.p4  ORF type:complete len:107 (-),score=5.25 TRINITY_DN6820_c0_g2_i2:291-611(-)
MLSTRNQIVVRNNFPQLQKKQQQQIQLVFVMVVKQFAPHQNIKQMCVHVDTNRQTDKQTMKLFVFVVLCFPMMMVCNCNVYVSDVYPFFTLQQRAHVCEQILGRCG